MKVFRCLAHVWVSFLCCLAGGSCAEKSFNRTFFVSEIFQKYGHKDFMTYEGFEHLLENLGLGRLKFDINHDVSIHKVNGTFHEFHEKLNLHKHNYEKENERNFAKRNAQDYEIYAKDNSQRTRSCLTLQDLLATYGLETSHAVIISQKGFVEMCPAIVYELDEKSCGYENFLVESSSVQPEYHLVWLYASLSISVMSVFGLLCILVVPVVTNRSYMKLLEFLVAMGVGTLCGDALLHLLPHVLTHKVGEESQTAPILRGAFALLSTFFFFFIEIILKFFQRQKVFASTVNEETGKIVMVQEEAMHISEGHHHHQSVKGDAVASMVIIGDILHNVTDGLSIGAAFTSSIPSGFASSIAIFSHELPHELGDYAALVSNGMSKKKTLLYNLVSSIFSFIGMIGGILLGKVQHASLWINAFTSGSFLYIALSDLIPEMKSCLEKNYRIKIIFIQLGGLLCGGVIMLCVAIFEEKLEMLLT